MRTFFAAVLCGIISLGSVSKTADAHFQLIYAPEAVHEKPGALALKLIFWHPFENGLVMDMAVPQDFSVYFRGEKTDLSPSLKQITFTGTQNSAKAFDAELSLKRSGDYHVVLTPAPYYEESEDVFIQQITKMTFNKGEMPSDWHEPLGLVTEIVPLSKPYGVLTGSTFRGLVLADGKPVAGAEIEVEHLHGEPDMTHNRPRSAHSKSHPGGAITILSDANGIFTFGIPKDGYWGFAALGSGPAKEYKGKKLSQDAVIWVQAHTME